MTPVNLSGLMKAVETLAGSLDVYDERSGQGAAAREKEVLRAGVIQAFEFTYELCWKHMKRWLETNLSPDEASGVNRREFFRICAENFLIDDVNQWMEFHQARNRAPHTYNEDMAAEVFAAARQFLPYAKDCLKRLEERT